MPVQPSLSPHVQRYLCPWHPWFSTMLSAVSVSWCSRQPNTKLELQISGTLIQCISLNESSPHLLASVTCEPSTVRGLACCAPVTEEACSFYLTASVLLKPRNTDTSCASCLRFRLSSATLVQPKLQWCSPLIITSLAVPSA